MQYQPLSVAALDPRSTAEGWELDPRAGDANARIHVPTSAAFYEAAIEGITQLDEQILKQSPDFPPIYESGVIYRKEAQDVWRHADDVLCSGWGDCDDLAPWRAAELRVSGEDPDAYVYVYQSGPHRYHAVVARGNGRIEDPSLILGMKVSAERRRQMPQFAGQGEGYPDNSRAFGSCPRTVMGDAGGRNRARPQHGRQQFRDESIGDASQSMLENSDRSEQHACSMQCPHHANSWKQAVRGAIMGDDGDDGSQDYVDQSQPDQSQPDQSQPDQAQPDQPQDQGPRGPSKAAKVGRFFSSAASTVFTPVKYAANIAMAPIKFGGQVLKTGADVAKGAFKIASLPLKGLSKIFSLFGTDGLDKLSPHLMGIEEDEDYEEGDEEVVTHRDIFTTPEFDEAEDEDFEEVAAAAPLSQRMRFDTAQVAPGVWGGRVVIPRIDQPGQALAMYTSPARSEMEAAERMRNLAMQAAQNPGIQMVVSPSALITMAAMRAGQSGKIGNALRAIGKFVRFEGE
jgi:hypothetical protein